VCVSETHQSEYNVCVSETLYGTSNIIIVLYYSQLQQPFHKYTRSQYDELTKTILSQRRHCRSISSRSFKKQQRSNNKTKPTTSRSAKPSSHSTNYGHNTRRRHRRKNHLPRNWSHQIRRSSKVQSSVSSDWIYKPTSLNQVVIDAQHFLKPFKHCRRLLRDDIKCLLKHHLFLVDACSTPTQASFLSRSSLESLK